MRNKTVEKRRASDLKTLQTDALINTSCDCKMRPNHDAMANEKLASRLKEVSVNYW